MKTSELRRLGADELAAELEKNQKELLTLRCKTAMGEDAKSSDIRKARKEIARIKTIQTQRAAEEALSAGSER